VPLPSKVDGCIGEHDIDNMWQKHYATLLNSARDDSHKKYVSNKINETRSAHITISPHDIMDSLSMAKCGKACGIDGLAAEHFKYADDIICVHLSLLFTGFLTHGYLPSDFMMTAIIPILKNKTGDTSDTYNYRPIAIVTAISKLFEIYLLSQLEHFLKSNDYQFGFKKQHSTDMCIFTVKTICKYYNNLNSPVFSCFFRCL
jgi:hypothetical protein